MSVAFPTDKDRVIDDMDDTYGLRLTDEEHGTLRRLTTSELFLVTALLARATKNSSVKEPDDLC